MKDIAPELLKKIQSQFEKEIDKNERIKVLRELLRNKEATHKESNELAVEIGEVLAKVFKENLSSEILPDGKMYYNIAERVINPPMHTGYDLVAEYGKEAQYILNKASNITMKGIKPAINQNRIDGIINRISEEENFDDIKWILEEPVKNFAQSVVDDLVKINIEFQYNSGLKPRIIRRESGNCCDWCKEVVGVYEYPNVPEDVYRRHRFCRCTVEYDPGDGKIQNVHTKKWVEPDKENKIEKRKKANLNN